MGGASSSRQGILCWHLWMNSRAPEAVRSSPTCGGLPTPRQQFLIEVDAVPHASRIPRKEFIFPDLTSCRQLFESLRITKLAGEFSLGQAPDAVFKVFDSRFMSARCEDKREKNTKKEEARFRHVS